MPHTNSKMYADRFLIYSLSACVALSVIGFEFFSGLTAPRLALIFSLVAGCITLTGKYVRVKMNSILLIYFLLGSVFFFSAVMSYILVGGSDWAVISWLLMGILGFFVCLGFLATNVESQKSILNIIFFFGLLFFISIFTYFFLLGIIWKPGYFFRFAADQFATVGLNRVVNAMVFFAGVAFVISFDKKSSLFLKRVPAVLMLAFMVYFSFAAGARQGIVGTVLFVVSYFFARTLRDGFAAGFRGALLRVAPAIFGLLIIGYLFVDGAGSDAADWFLSRFLGSVENQGSSGDIERLDAINSAISFGFLNSGFGVGLGNFKILHGIEPHNGYLGLFAEIGIYFFIFNIIVLFVFLIMYYLPLKNREGNLSLFLMAYLPVHFLFLLNVKDILREPFTWALLGTIGVIGTKFRQSR